MNGRPDFSSGRSGTGGSGREYGGYDYAGYRARDNSSSASSLTNGLSSSNRERRTGGYGGFYDTPSTSTLGTRDTHEWRAPSRSRVRDVETGTLWSSSRDDSRYGTGRERNRSDATRGGGIDDVIRLIQDEWDFMASDECVPVQVALQLMDSSTLGRAATEPDFLRAHRQTQKALRSIVNEHHQGFNSSIGTYHKIQSSIQNSQNRIRVLKAALAESKGGLITTKPELKGLATASQTYDDLLQLLGQIEYIQGLPEKLEGRISEKRFIAAVEILQEALRLVHRTELDNIGGLEDVRTYFSNQQSSLTDILVEELHDHLYLKSPYCQDRWKLPARDETRGGPNARPANGITPWEKPVYRFLASLDVSAPMVEDASRNPEADTFYYIRLIIESLNKMGNLEVAVDRIEQRLPVELYAVVDKTSAEVDSRYPMHVRNIPSITRKSDILSDGEDDRRFVLSEFLWNLFAKFEAIAEGHRVVHDVVTGIVEREGIRKPGSLTSGFKELWKLYQSEMRYLLHDYLATDGESLFRTAAGATGGVSGLSSVQRDKSKKLFKLSEIDKKSSDLKAEHDELDQILRSSVPGLVSKSRQKTPSNDRARSTRENSGTGHRLLIAPSVFNISLLLPPALSFIQRIKDIVPLTSDIVLSTLTSFLDNFLINVFQPQLDETVTDLCSLTFIAADAYMEDSQWSGHSSRAIFKGTISFMKIVQTFSRMLDSIPYDQAFTQLIVNQIVTYHDKSYGWYKALVSRVSPQHQGGARLKASAGYAELQEIRDVVRQLWEGPTDGRQEWINKEIDILIKHTNDKPLESYDVVSDPKTVLALSLLYNSMQWLSTNLSRLRHIIPQQTDSSLTEPKRARGRSWTLISAKKAKRDTLDRPAHLPMTKESVVAFDKAITSLQSLALTALFTLHTDIRCGAIHMVTKSLAGNNPLKPTEPQPTSPASATDANWAHVLTSIPNTASPSILELNNDLISFHATMSSYLGQTECRFVTSGLARLIDQAFISSTRFIGAMNRFGAERLQLDVLVLQQNLKNVITDAPVVSRPKIGGGNHSSNLNVANIKTSNIHEVIALPRSAKFLDWFMEGPDKALENAKREKEDFKVKGSVEALKAGDGEPLTYEEMKVLIDLCFSEMLRGPRGAESREDFMAAKRGNGDALLKLSEIMWDS